MDQLFREGLYNAYNELSATLSVAEAELEAVEHFYGDDIPAQHHSQVLRLKKLSNEIADLQRLYSD